ncbi:GNAT family N-acetyltransferase [Streptomyces sp. NPDC087440]|uniref:GNAT family N-acetyltransferase n=1 Tax=Streptomyces sp. NPDC087440 TaxID=3365790 RepID=UPI003827A00C
MAVDVVDAREAGRYEARVDGAEKIAGIAQYIRTPELIAFVHTEVEPAHEGQGVGGTLVRVSLDAARAEGLRVLAVCPFYTAWLQRHPEYADLLYQSRSSVTD